MAALLDGKTAVVMGAASGNGRAIARRFATAGADVVIADLQAEDRMGGDPTHEVIEGETDARAAFVECDVTDRDDLEAAVSRAEEFGGLDAMVNNAGIVGPQKPLTEVGYEEYRQLMDVNLDEVYFGTQIAAAAMIDRGEGGSIINMSSVAGLEGTAGITPYSAAKGGVRLFTYAAAADLGPEGIRVNAIHPGAIETAMTTEDSPVFGTEQEEQMSAVTPLRRLGQPEDVANVVLFLASELSDFVTAESIAIDGGLVDTA
jgi:NAD(P)-dependent dehydrogenase (short-subunit alcohol dehydrogenase family)